MDATMSLVERLKTDKHQGFNSRPRYYSHGDYVTYFIDPARCHARRLNSLVTVYTAVDDGRLVGCKLKGITKLMETLKMACFLATDGKVMMGMLLLSAAAIEKESNAEVLGLSEKFGQAPVQVEQMCEQAA